MNAQIFKLDWPHSSCDFCNEEQVERHVMIGGSHKFYCCNCLSLEWWHEEIEIFENVHSIDGVLTISG